MQKQIVKRVTMTEEQRLEQRAQIFMQKKEQYALNAALKLIEVRKPKTAKDMEKVVALADTFSTTLLDTLFRVEEKEPNADSEGNDSTED